MTDSASDTIFKRRSIRKYTGEPISDELVERLLRAAMVAPSAGNEQPWQFIGYPGENRPPVDRFNPERVHLEQW